MKLNKTKHDVDSKLRDLTQNPLFYTFLNSLHDGVMITDNEETVRFVNKAYVRITGVNDDEIMGKKLSDIRKGARLPEVLKTGIALHGAKRKEYGIEYVADIDPVFSGEKIIGAIAILRDITELQDLTAKLTVYSSQVEEFKNSVRSIHKAAYTIDDIIGESESINDVKNIVKKVSASNSSVLIQGESGTGKELFAHAIHNHSRRANNPFVAVNCAAFPPNLLLSEIFGYEKGSFTGASKGGKLGLFEVADKGSLFLDEIGDMDLELQAKILRVLETGEFLRIGGTKPVKIDVRLISATNRDVEDLIWQKKFREDLLYRLNVVAIRIPPLRQRLEDLPLLISHFQKEISKRTGKTVTVSNEALVVLRGHLFPGNVRELLNILEFSSNISESDIITPSHLPMPLGKRNKSADDDLDNTVKNAERERIVSCLRKYGMSVNAKKRVAAELDISLSSLYNKIRQYNIKKDVNVSA